MIWIAHSPEGFLTQVSVGDSKDDPLGVFGDTHRQLTPSEEALCVGLDASEIHRRFAIKGGKFVKLSASAVGKVWYPDTKHFIDPATRGKGPQAVNPSPPAGPDTVDSEP